MEINVLVSKKDERPHIERGNSVQTEETRKPHIDMQMKLGY